MTNLQLFFQVFGQRELQWLKKSFFFFLNPDCLCALFFVIMSFSMTNSRLKLTNPPFLLTAIVDFGSQIYVLRIYNQQLCCLSKLLLVSKVMAFKLDRKHRDYLFWIYPLIILGLLIIAVNRYEQKRELASLTGANIKIDTSLNISLKKGVVDSITNPDKTQQTNFFTIFR